MNKTVKDNRHLQRIAELIFKSIQDKLSKEEQKFLANWISEDESNRELYNKLRNLEGFPEWMNSYKRFMENSDWNDIEKKIAKPTRKLVLQVLSYAAIFLAIISIGSYFLFFNTSRNHIPPQESHIIHPGTSRAILSFDDGRKISLDSSSSMVLTEPDGTIIQKSKATVDYSNMSDESQNIKSTFNTISTPRGSEFSVVLSDGSRVFLNSMSSIRYPVKFDSNKRIIELKGEAFFDVKNLKNKPFIVKVNSVNIEVLGTSFNINAYTDTDEVITTLVEGNVKVKETGEPDNSKMLQPNQQSTFDLKTGENTVRTVNVNLYTDWKNGKFNFHNESLETIMTVLSRWYEINVEYDNSDIKQMVFSGSMERYENLTKILDIIEATKKVNYTFKNDSTLLFTKTNRFLNH